MNRYDLLYSLYEEFDTDDIRASQDFVGVFPPVDSRVALEYWRDATDALQAQKAGIRERFSDGGEALADVAAHATREQAFTALDLLGTYDRSIDVLVLDVDETLRSAGNTDNEIPRETLYLLTALHEQGLPIVICTGQTLENVKGFLIQGLGNELVYSGDVSVVYEAGSGVFTPGHGADTKRLLYDALDDDVRRIFDAVRTRVLPEAPDRLRQECHLQGNEFNVTLKPNYETGSAEAREVIERALVYQLELLGTAVAAELEREAEDGSDGDDGSEGSDGRDGGDGPWWARTYYADADPEIRSVLESRDAATGADPDEVPEDVRAIFDRIDVAYYEADAAEIGSLELNKVAGVEAAFDVLGLEDPFSLVVGDSKTDLRVMEWVAERDAGIAAAPKHASEDVLVHVRETDDLVFARGDAGDVLRTAYALDQLASLE